MPSASAIVLEKAHEPLRADQITVDAPAWRISARTSSTTTGCAASSTTVLPGCRAMVRTSRCTPWPVTPPTAWSPPRAVVALPEVIQLAAEGKIDLDRLITRRFSFEQTPGAYQLLNERNILGSGLIETNPVLA